MSDPDYCKSRSSENINDTIMSFYKAKHFVLDSYLREKFTKLNEMNITSEHFGGHKAHTIKLTSSVVELSVLDSYCNPEPKLNCLCTTYDLIFAELKSAIASSISKYSDTELDIPIIDNRDILPIVMSVIVKSKLPYLWSNIKFLEFFYEESIKDKANDKIRILKLFQEATKHLLSFSEDSIEESACEEDFHSLSLLEVINLSGKVEETTEQTDSAKGDLLQEQTNLIVDLITTSTTTSDPV